METLPPLGARLRLAASFVRQGAVAADIGTDHAYLPVWLVKSGRCPRAAASDVRPGPLARAAETVARYGVQDRVRLLQADGVPPTDAADLIVAGMGGELIARIVGQSVRAKEPGVQLVLQPMTAQAALRAWLCRSGFEIWREDAAEEGGKHYLVIGARWGAAPFEPDALFRVAGRLPQTGGAAASAYLLWQAARLRRRAEGLARSALREKEADAFFRLAGQVEQAARGCAPAPLSPPAAGG